MAKPIKSAHHGMRCSIWLSIPGSLLVPLGKRPLRREWIRAGHDVEGGGRKQRGGENPQR